MKLHNGKLILNGNEYDNPLDGTILKREYAEGKESPRISFKRIYISRYIFDNKGVQTEYQSCELKLCSNGKVFLDGKEIKDNEEVSSVKEIFNSIKVE